MSQALAPKKSLPKAIRLDHDSYYDYDYDSYYDYDYQSYYDYDSYNYDYDSYYDYYSYRYYLGFYDPTSTVEIVFGLIVTCVTLSIAGCCFCCCRKR